MFLRGTITGLSFVAVVYASVISNRTAVIKDCLKSDTVRTETLQGTTRAIQLRVVDCPALGNTAQATPNNDGVSKRLVTRSAGECTIAGCQCGFACTGTACVNNGEAVPSLSDCDTLAAELEDTFPRTFLVGSGQVASAVSGTCAFAVVNDSGEQIEYCTDDLAVNGNSLVISCAQDQRIPAGGCELNGGPVEVVFLNSE